MKKTLFITIILSVLLLLSAGPSPIILGQVFTPKREETLYTTRGSVTDPTNLNMFVPGGGAPNLWALVYEYLFYYNILTGEMVPWLAEKFEYLDNYTRMRVYLRRGVTWSDGYPFTADDVIFWYNVEMNYTTLSYSAPIRANIAEVKKIDDYTVDIILKSSNPAFHFNGQAFPAAATYPCFTIMPKHIWEGEDPTKFKNNPPIGTGPYKLIQHDERVTIYERRDDWWATELWGIRPTPKYIVMTYYGTAEAVAAALSTNEVDLTFMGTQLGMGLFSKVRDTNPYVRSYSTVEPMAFPSSWSDDVYINNDKYPWSLKEVRHAIKYLINRQVIYEVATERTMPPCYTPFGRLSLISPAFKPFWDAIKPIFDKYEINVYDPAKAEEIFKSLGFTRGPDGIWVTPNGTRLEGEFLVSAEADPVEYVRPAQVIVEQLRSGGIDVTLKSVTGVIYTDRVNKGLFDFAIGAKTGTIPLPIFRLYEYHSKYAKPVGESTSLNQWRFRNATMDAIVDEMEKTLPTEKEKLVSLFKQAMEIFCDQLPEIPTHSPDKLVQANTYYWTGWPFAENAYAVFGSPHWPQFIWWVAGYRSTITGEWVSSLRPKYIDYTTVYFTKDTPKFRGIDLIWYGPFKPGDAARIPVDDADFWINKGYASFTPPTPPITGLEEISAKLDHSTSSLTNLNTKIEDTLSGISAISGTVNSLIIAVIIEAIVIVVLVISLMRRKT